MRRKNADVEAEYNAVTCVAVYMLLMSFSQKGIDKLRSHQEHIKMRYPDEEFVVSEGFDDGTLEAYVSFRFSHLILRLPALVWFKNHFVKCNNRAAMVKTWLPAPQESTKSWLDQLVYDRALTLVSAVVYKCAFSTYAAIIIQSRTAARKELLDQASSPDECEKLYEESLWCLYALQDDLLQTGNPFLEEDRATIATCMLLCFLHFVSHTTNLFFAGIKRTKLRLVRCRARMAMNDRDRLNDARADQNLVDVARYPAPWELRPSEQPQTSPSAQRLS
jgi:serine/threonine-protein kinase ULK2